MLRHSFAILLCAFIALFILQPITARKSYGGSSRHSYPKSTGLSGGGHHYPSSSGLSGGGHGYPSSGGSHSYPSSGGLSGSSSGHQSSGGSHTYPSPGSNHGYPGSGGLSGSGSANTHHSNTHGYPAGKGLSGNSATGHTTTNVNYHYHYTPPQQIRYTPAYGGAPVSYPVYRGSPPTYVYQYKDSGSKYGTLLAGLALFNLGALAGGVYGHSQSHSNYKPQPGEVCKFGVKKDNGDYEETKIDCQLITSFIFAEQAKAQNGASNTTVITTTVMNTTTINTTNSGPDSAPVPAAAPTPNYTMLPNGTLIPVNMTSLNTTTNVTGDGSTANNTMTSSVTTVVTSNTTTVTNALDVKGKPIDVTPGMKCYVIRHTPSTNMRKSVPCGLLQTYADQSIKRNSAARSIPTFSLIAAIFSVLMFY